MNDLEHAVREALRRRERDVPMVDWDDAPVVAHRTRRRQLRNGAGGVLLAIGIAAAAAIGVGAVVRTDQGTPAGRDDLKAPADAPIVVKSGNTQGWAWLLSVSHDGTCVALTDRQGSETTCATEADAAALPGDEGSTALLDVAIRSPRPPAPALVFVFGRISPRVDRVELDLGIPTPVMGLTSEGVSVYNGLIFDAPQGLMTSDRYYMAWLAGVPSPIVPDLSVVAFDSSRRAPLDRATVTRPAWAQPPFTSLEIIGSGTWRSPLGDELEPWEIGIYRNEVTGEPCLGELSGAPSQCMTSDQLSMWLPAPVEIVGFKSSTTSHTGTALVWGIYRDPVTSLSVRLPAGQLVDQRTFPPPQGYPFEFSVFVFEFEYTDEYTGGSVVGLDANGEIVERAEF